MPIFNQRIVWRTLNESRSSQPSTAIKPTAMITIVCLFLVLSTGVLFSRIKTTPFLPDESGWISAGLYYSKLLVNLDFTSSNWECPACEGFGSLNPNVGKWLLGLPITILADIESSRSDLEFFAFIDYSKSPEENVIVGNVPGRDL